MENYRTLILILAVGLLPAVSFAYERNTHKGLSGATTQVYEQLRGDRFSAAEESALIQGSWDEDDDWRFMRHFYDPVNNRGLTKLAQAFMASKYWAQDTEVQGNYHCINSWLCNGKHIGYNDKFFSSPTDFSWNRAVYEYTWGDKIRGAAALGHVIHLIQDASVPAHVRNDAHPNHDGRGDADPYEYYTGRFGPSAVDVPQNLSISNFPGIAFSFDDIATYTNRNFVSKDTISAFDEPDFNKLPTANGYAINIDGIKIAKVEEHLLKKGNDVIIKKEIKITDENDVVLNDTWRVLSKKAIETGVGVIDLFFREVEIEKRTGRLKAMNTSAAERAAKEQALKGFKYVKRLYGSSLEESDVAELLNTSQAGAVALAVESPSPEPSAIPESEAEVQINEPEAVREIPVPTVQDPPVAIESDQPTVEVPKPPEIPPLPQPLFTVTPGFGGGGASLNTESQPQTSNTPAVFPLTIQSPTENQVFSTTTVRFSGTTEVDAALALSYSGSSATTTADGSGNWAVDLLLTEGSVSVTVLAEKSGNSTTTTRNITVDLTAPNAPSASVDECADSLTAAFCGLPSETATLSWAAISGAASYSIENNGAVTNVASATSSVVNLSSGTTTMAVVVYDSAGNAATSSSISIFKISKPIIINEVGWAGDDASASNQWIELKNTSPYGLDLSSIEIQRSGGSAIALSGNLAAGEYLVVERENLTGINANELITPFDLLSAVGEELKLIWRQGSMNATLDQTPAIATCGGWCAGASSAQIGTNVQSLPISGAPLSMERISDSATANLSQSWRNTDGYGASYNGFIWGTPGAANTRDLPESGWFCASDGPIEPSSGTGPAYVPGSNGCTYLSAFISSNVNRVGVLYRGTLGSSAQESGHFMGGDQYHVESDIITAPVAGENFFVAIWESRSTISYPNDGAEFGAYFTTGTGTPPHSNYRVIPWVYGP